MVSGAPGTRAAGRRRPDELDDVHGVDGHAQRRLDGAAAYANRLYQYDPSLRYLSPPWFRTLPNSMTVLYSRQINP